MDKQQIQQLRGLPIEGVAEQNTRDPRGCFCFAG